MIRFLLLIFFVIGLAQYASSQYRILVIDYNNNETSDQKENGSQIYNHLVETNPSVQRINKIPNYIDQKKYDQVWIFGNMRRTNSSTLDPVINYINSGGAVYVQSEVNCCNAVANYVEKLIHRVVIDGDNISHKINTKGPTLLKFNSLVNCGEKIPACAARKFEGMKRENILLKVDPVCARDRDAFDDVFGVFFKSCDMKSSRGALISIGDFNVFPSNTDCHSCTPIGSTNSFVVPDKIYYLFPYLLICSDFKDFVPNVNIGRDTSLCIGDSILLDASDENAYYVWSNFSREPKTTYYKSGRHWVDITKNGCKAVDSINLIFDTIPSIQLGHDTIICMGDYVELKANFPDANYQWQDNSADEIYSVNEKGDYWVKVDNDCGVNSDTIHIDLKDCSCSVFAPNAFSPTDDNINDYFQIWGECPFTEYHLMIYNRWGMKIFESFDPLVYWDGTLNNKKLPMGVYVYLLEYKFDHNKRWHKTGSITLISN